LTILTRKAIGFEVRPDRRALATGKALTHTRLERRRIGRRVRAAPLAEIQPARASPLRRRLASPRDLGRWRQRRAALHREGKFAVGSLIARDLAAAGRTSPQRQQRRKYQNAHEFSCPGLVPSAPGLVGPHGIFKALTAPGFPRRARPRHPD